MLQNTLRPKLGSKKSKKRIGRGNSSGHGNYSGRGVKGQNSRTGGQRRPGFEGGQMPLHRRMPKLKGFNPIMKKIFSIINVETLNIFENDAKVDITILKEKELIKNTKNPVKILGNGELTKKLHITANAFSKSAKEQIEKLGGSVILSQPQTTKKED